MRFKRITNLWLIYRRINEYSGKKQRINGFRDLSEQQIYGSYRRINEYYDNKKTNKHGGQFKCIFSHLEQVN